MSVVCVVSFLFLVLLICVIFFFLISLDKSLPILLLFFRELLKLVLLIFFYTVFLFSNSFIFVVVQSLKLCQALCNLMDCSTPGFPFTISQSLPKFMSIQLVMPSKHLVLCCPLLLPPSIFPSIRVFSDELALHVRWPKYWSFHFSISPSSEYSELISFRIDWFDLLAVQGTLKNLLQHHN